MLPDKDFIEAQYQFAQYIRDPDNTDCPDGIEKRRMSIYSDLFFNNINSFVSNNFPVFRALVNDKVWEKIIRLFMTQHRCQTPIFAEIGKEFIQFIESDAFQEHALAGELYPFTVELLWYEYLELMLSIDKAVIHWPKLYEQKDTLLNQTIHLSELTQLGQFSWPVHQICEDYIPADDEKKETFILIHRDRDHGIHFLELSPVANLLFQKISVSEAMSGREILQQLAEEINFPSTEEFINAGLTILQSWYLKDIIYTGETNADAGQ
jgi:hypothetical protein